MGTLAMNIAQRAWTVLAGSPPRESAAGPHDARDWQERDEGQNSNELAAQALASLAGHRLTDRQLAIAAPAIHFAFGAAVGFAYGAITAARDRHTGVGLGTALWLTADEIAMPLLGLSGPTTRRPLEIHLQSLAAHLVYGVVTEHVRRIADPQPSCARK